MQDNIVLIEKDGLLLAKYIGEFEFKSAIVNAFHIFELISRNDVKKCIVDMRDLDLKINTSHLQQLTESLKEKYPELLLKPCAFVSHLPKTTMLIKLFCRLVNESNGMAFHCLTLECAMKSVGVNMSDYDVNTISEQLDMLYFLHEHKVSKGLNYENMQNLSQNRSKGLN